MNYSKYFAQILLEDTDIGNPTHDNESDNPLASFLDDGTNEDAFDTEGIADSLKKIEDNFDKKMALLDNIDGMDKHEINSRLDQLEEYLTTLRAFVDSKDEVDMKNPYSVMANIIRRDTVKKTNFDQVTKAIENYKNASKKEEQATEQAAREVKDSLGDLAKARKSVTSTGGSESPEQTSGPYDDDDTF